MCVIKSKHSSEWIMFVMLKKKNVAQASGIQRPALFVLYLYGCAHLQFAPFLFSHKQKNGKQKQTRNTTCWFHFHFNTCFFFILYFNRLVGVSAWLFCSTSIHIHYVIILMCKENMRNFNTQPTKKRIPSHHTSCCSPLATAANYNFIEIPTSLFCVFHLVAVPRVYRGQFFSLSFPWKQTNRNIVWSQKARFHKPACNGSLQMLCWAHQNRTLGEKMVNKTNKRKNQYKILNRFHSAFVWWTKKRAQQTI